jgi:predicted  nucleic acid-binding Zn-ribbon protein
LVSIKKGETNMEKELKDYLAQSFEKLVSKEELKKEVEGLKSQVSDLRAELRSEASSLRGEMKHLGDQAVHQFHITAEALRDDIKQVAEGVMNLNEKFGREMSEFRKELTYSHEELKAMIKFCILRFARHGHGHGKWCF